MAIEPFRIGLIGFGNIGTGFVRHLLEHGKMLSERAGRPLELAAIADKEFERPRDVTPPEWTRMTTNWRELTDDDSINLIVELVGVGPDGKPSLAYQIAKAALGTGKHFVTANKALIAQYGGELHELAEQNGVLLLYEASAGAGTPLIATLQITMAPDRITAVHGILNGTSNYILTRMEEDESLTLDSAIEEAQRLGYAEPNPSADVNGDDALYKIVILASLAFGQRISIYDVSKEGITQLRRQEFQVAQKHGWALKLLASAIRRTDDAIQIAVRPVFIPANHIMAGVRGVYNGMLLDGVPVGPTMYYGQGAGQPSTGSGLLADVLLAARHQGDESPYPLRIPTEEARLVLPEHVIGCHYIRVDIGGEKVTREKIEPLLLGEVISADEEHIAVMTEFISEREAGNILGKLTDAGVSSERMCHVRFAFFESY